MTFYEQRLDLGINYGATFGPRFNTAVLTQSDGQEQRRALWSQPLILAQLGDRRVTQSELNTLLAFHATVKGAAIGFRLRDWSDYKATNQAIGTGNGTVQTWQLVKTYAISTATVTRAITKPVAGSVVVYVDGVEEENGWSVDTTTGVLTTELTGAIAVDFEFDVPVRFEQDKIDFTFEAKGLFTLAPLTCTEIRVEPAIYPALDTLPGSLEEIIDLGYDFGTLGGPSFSTGIKANAAEFELRKSYWEASIGSWDIGDRLLIRSELDYMIRLFRVCRGMAIPFQFKDWQSNTTKKVRFAEDRISFRFEAYSEEEVIFNLGGVAVAEVAEPSTQWYHIVGTVVVQNADNLSTLVFEFDTQAGIPYQAPVGPFEPMVGELFGGFIGQLYLNVGDDSNGDPRLIGSTNSYDWTLTNVPRQKVIAYNLTLIPANAP